MLLVDDHELARAGYRTILEHVSDVVVVGEASDGRSAVAQAAALRPDVVLMDVRMPLMDGIEATRRVVRGPGPARVIVLTAFDLDGYVADAIRAGASGFLLKNVKPHGLIEAIRTVASGDALIAPSVTRRLLARFISVLPEGDTSVLETLTPRELEVFRLAAKGMSNAEIAQQLHLSAATVKSYVSRMLPKLGVPDRVHLVIRAYELGIARTDRDPPPASVGGPD